MHRWWSTATQIFSEERPVFVGTRVPLRNLIDYLEGGYSLDEFLDEFPSVSRDQAISALEAAHEILTIRARASR